MWEAEVMDWDSKSWVSVESHNFCYDDHALEIAVESCFLFVDSETKAQQFSAVKLSKTSVSSPEIKHLHKTDSIENSNIRLTYEGLSYDLSGVRLSYLNKKTFKKEILDIKLKNWDDLTDKGVQHSGSYIFTQSRKQYKPKMYSIARQDKFSYTKGISESGKYIQGQMTFYFGNPNVGFNNTMNRNAMIHVSIDNDLDVIKADVDLDSLPSQEDGGFEAIAMFELHRFKNQGVFFTDSNGLEMQKRKLNYRPTWDLVNINYERSLENITANFYPVNSAVSMVDGNRKFTVMNDRSQAASALEDGSIQFIQNRRIFMDDGRGEALQHNEVDKNGNGIRVPATYYIDIAYLDKDGQGSKQR